MDEWKARAVKKKDWKRGGIEPDPPRKARSVHKLPKIYKVQYKWRQDWFGDGSWRGWDSYRTMELAHNKVKKLKREGNNLEYSHYKAFRIINKKTKEVLWEENL